VRAAADVLRLRHADAATVDRARVLALDGDDVVVGRATVSRLYGARGEIRLELATSDEVARCLLDAVEYLAVERGIQRLELDARAVSAPLLAALRASRPIRDEQRGTHLHLTWPTTTTR
jgi:hypothetical protein